MNYYGVGSSQFWPKLSFLLSLCIAVGTASTPVLLFIRRPSWLAWVFASCLVTWILSLRQLKARQARPLTNLERLLLVVAVLFGASSVAVVVAIGFFFAKILSSFLASSAILILIFGRLAVFNACFFLLGALMTTAPVLLKTIFPKTGVGNPPLFPGFTWRKIAIPGLIALALIVLLALIGHFFWVGAYVGILAVQVAASLPVSVTLDLQKSAPVPTSIAALTVLLEAIGFKSFDRLQTGELTLDRLIAVFDLVAYKSGTALAIQCKIGNVKSEPVSWTEASPLRAAVWAIYRAAREKQLSLDNVLPVLVLSGRQADNSLVEFAKEEDIEVLVLPGDAPLDAIANRSLPAEEIRQWAKSLLPARLYSPSSISEEAAESSAC